MKHIYKNKKMRNTNFYKISKLAFTAGLLLAVWLMSVQALKMPPVELTVYVPGEIFRPSSPVSPFLDPNGDGWAKSNCTAPCQFSASASSDFYESEIPFVPIPGYNPPETVNDLLTGSTCGQSEIVIDPAMPYASSNYVYYTEGPDGIRDTPDDVMVYRMRIATEPIGAFAFSILIDTDGNIGGSDPNRVSGNPGFEREIMVATGGGSSGVNILNVDGTTSGTNVCTYSFTTNTQYVGAKYSHSSCPSSRKPVFIDFFCPLSCLGVSTSDAIRLIGATSSSPASALGGSASDIAGVNDKDSDANTAGNQAWANQDSIFSSLISLQGGGVEVGQLNSDNDKDGIADAQDIDDDNDGILDTTEGGGTDPSADVDGDGVPNYRDETFAGFIDANADGLNDNFDNDMDGIIDIFDLDSDNDGIYDIVEGGGSSTLDTNNDGVIDSTTDADKDGLMDVADGVVAGGTPGTYLSVPDSDGDGIRDFFDLDSDNDGLTDLSEAAANGGATSLDANNDGILDSTVDIDQDGISLM